VCHPAAADSNVHCLQVTQLLLIGYYCMNCDGPEKPKIVACRPLTQASRLGSKQMHGHGQFGILSHSVME
jgi:hypothetical protein